MKVGAPRACQPLRGVTVPTCGQGSPQAPPASRAPPPEGVSYPPKSRAPPTEHRVHCRGCLQADCSCSGGLLLRGSGRLPRRLLCASRPAPCSPRHPLFSGENSVLPGPLRPGDYSVRPPGPPMRARCRRTMVRKVRRLVPGPGPAVGSGHRWARGTTNRWVGARFVALFAGAHAPNDSVEADRARGHNSSPSNEERPFSDCENTDVLPIQGPSGGAGRGARSASEAPRWSLRSRAAKRSEGPASPPEPYSPFARRHRWSVMSVWRLNISIRDSTSSCALCAGSQPVWVTTLAKVSQ